MIAPSENLHRFLISTTSRFTGSYESQRVRIDHAWTLDGPPRRVWQGFEEGPLSRNFFALSLLVDPPEKESILEPSVDWVGDQFCILLSIFFGKRFDNHGMFVSKGRFSVPNLEETLPISYSSEGPYGHQPRGDLGIPLVLDRFAPLVALASGEVERTKATDLLFAAGKFYLRSLQVFERQPEFAYLDLVNCGEVLANFRRYRTRDLLDDETRGFLVRIREELEGGKAIEKRLLSGMRQITERYTRTLLGLLTKRFFEGSECDDELWRIDESGIEKRIRASYKLRSSYLHSGASFGTWIRPRGPGGSEITIPGGRPVGMSQALSRVVTSAPSFMGLERIMRFCLLRFIHLKIVPFEEALDGPGLDVRGAEAEDSVPQAPG